MFKVTYETRSKAFYSFEFTTETRDCVLKRLGQLAADPNVDFTWYDAACVSEKIRKATFGDFVHFEIVLTRYRPVTTQVCMMEGYQTQDKYKTMSEIINRHRECTPVSWSVDVRIISAERAAEIDDEQCEIDAILTKIGVEL
jgi:hypothetical protein